MEPLPPQILSFTISMHTFIFVIREIIRLNVIYSPQGMNPYVQSVTILKITSGVMWDSNRDTNSVLRFQNSVAIL